MTDPSTDEHTLLGLLADIRAAAGDREGRLMQAELVEHIRGLKARADQAEQLRAEVEALRECWNCLRSLSRHVERMREAGLVQCDDTGPEDWARALLSQPGVHWVNPLAAEVEALRAASVIEWEPGRSYTAAELLRRAIFGLRVRKNRPPWRAVSHLFGCGSGVAHHLCRWAGRDPDTGDAIDATRSDMEITP